MSNQDLAAKALLDWHLAYLYCISKIAYRLQCINPYSLNTACPVLANSADPDQLASSEANWSGSAMFVIKYVNFYQKPGLKWSDWLEIRSRRDILIYSAWQGLNTVAPHWLEHR